MCSKCILDTNDDPDIVFDIDGVCNHCKLYEDILHHRIFHGQEGKEKLKQLVDKIKKDGAGKEYDTIVGISGGVDSTYVAYLSKQLGLRPLLVHCDNGWNSELAVNNIENIVQRLNFDLYTYVINWEEFRDIQLSFLQASVVDIELITDHAITATLYRLASKYKIKHILQGVNITTEGLLPASWVHNKLDYLNIKDIHRRFGKVKLKTFPHLTLWDIFYYSKIWKVDFIPVLNYIDYNKAEAKQTIMKELGWRDYGGKHYESVFTRFYQAYILPQKFGIDKRKSHLSTLICSGQITQEEALEEMKKPIYDAVKLEEDKEYVIKKFGLTTESFDKLMKTPIVQHTEYHSMMNIYKKIRRLSRFYKK
jgi:N-acetyl sugar amidotransferase